VLVMVPAEELPPGTPFTVQLTEVLLAPVTVAVNCSVLPTVTVADGGVTVIETASGELAGPEALEVTRAEVPAPPHAEASRQRKIPMTALQLEKRRTRSPGGGRCPATISRHGETQQRSVSP
jgi:hypothetical protein